MRAMVRSSALLLCALWTNISYAKKKRPYASSDLSQDCRELLGDVYGRQAGLAYAGILNQGVGAVVAGLMTVKGGAGAELAGATTSTLFAMAGEKYLSDPDDKRTTALRHATECIIDKIEKMEARIKGSAYDQISGIIADVKTVAGKAKQITQVATECAEILRCKHNKTKSGTNIVKAAEECNRPHRLTESCDWSGYGFQTFFSHGITESFLATDWKYELDTARHVLDDDVGAYPAGPKRLLVTALHEGVVSFTAAYNAVVEWLVNYCHPHAVSGCSGTDIDRAEAAHHRWYDAIGTFHKDTVQFLAHMYKPEEIDKRKRLPNNDLRFTRAITCTDVETYAGPRCLFSDFSCGGDFATSQRRGHTQTCPYPECQQDPEITQRRFQDCTRNTPDCSDSDHCDNAPRHIRCKDTPQFQCTFGDCRDNIHCGHNRHGTVCKRSDPSCRYVEVYDPINKELEILRADAESLDFSRRKGVKSDQTDPFKHCSLDQIITPESCKLLHSFGEPADLYPVVEAKEVRRGSPGKTGGKGKGWSITGARPVEKKVGKGGKGKGRLRGKGRAKGGHDVF